MTNENPSHSVLRIRVAATDFNQRLDFVITSESDTSRAIATGINPLTFTEIGDDVIRQPTGYLLRAEAQDLADELYFQGFKPRTTTAELRAKDDEIKFLRSIIDKLSR